MPTYLSFYTLTDQGAKTIKDAPGRLEAASKAAERMGGKVLGIYVCQSGEYDYVSISEMPSDEAVKVFTMALEALGNVKVKGTKAYTRAEFADLVAKLP